jgi:hypothetical protein
MKSDIYNFPFQLYTGKCIPEGKRREGAGEGVGVGEGVGEGENRKTRNRRTNLERIAPHFFLIAKQ